MKQFIKKLLITVLFGALTASTVLATALLPQQGGTGTSTAPIDLQLLVGQGGGVYGVRTLTEGTNITIATSSNALTISVTTIGDSDWLSGTNLIYSSTTATAVGIGTSTPAYPLHINSASVDDAWIDSSGNMNLSGDLTVDGDNIKSGTATVITLADDSMSIADDLTIGGGRLNLNPDTGWANLGQAQIGAWETLTTHMSIGHNDLDQGVAGNFALTQYSTGDTFLNSATGKELYFQIANSTKARITSGGILFAEGGGEASLSDGSGRFMVGANEGGTNIIFDDNEIQARNNAAKSNLYIQRANGDVIIGDSTGASTMGRLGIGTDSPDGVLEARADDWDNTTIMVRDTSDTSSSNIALRVKAQSSGNIGDGFGPSIAFILRDNAGVDNTAAEITARRAGSDTKANIILDTNTGGVRPANDNDTALGGSSYAWSTIYYHSASDTTCADMSDYTKEQLYGMFKQIQRTTDGTYHETPEGELFPHIDMATLPDEFATKVIEDDFDYPEQTYITKTFKADDGQGGVTTKERTYALGDNIGIDRTMQSEAKNALIVKMYEWTEALEARIADLEAENATIKSELCKKDPTYSFCATVLFEENKTTLLGLGAVGLIFVGFKVCKKKKKQYA